MACCADAAQPLQHRMPDCSIPTREAAVANAIFDRWDGRSRQSTGPFSGRSPLANVTQCNVVGAPGNPKRRPEGKLVCNPESLFGAKDCVVVSVGCQNDYRFEEYLYRTTSCRVEVFDCTGKGRGWKVPEWIRSRVTLHDLCLGVPQWRYNQTRDRYQMLVAPSRKQTYETVTYHEMLAKAGLTVAPTFLKLDCEGCEVDLFRSLIDDGDTHLLPDQIAAEMHYPYGFDTDPNDFFSARFTDVHAKWPFSHLAHAMYRRAGFTIVGSLPGRPYGYSGCCEEVVFARTRCDATTRLKQPHRPSHSILLLGEGSDPSRVLPRT